MRDVVADQRRLKATLTAMAERYPQFKGGPSPSGIGFPCSWKGVVQPIADSDGLPELLTDLSADRGVRVHTRGVVRHEPNCQLMHAPPPFPISRELFMTQFELTVEWKEAPAHPAVRSVHPNISRFTYPDHPHLYSDGRICPVTPWLDEWDWEIHSVADYLDQVAIWLAKHLAWIAAGRGQNWLGTWSPHDPEEILAVVSPNDQCPCGSGKKFKKCCKPETLERHFKN